jgi:hypothetical protein
MTNLPDAQPSPWSRDSFRKSTRRDSSGTGQCVAVAAHDGLVAVGDTKTPVADSYAHLLISAEDFASLTAVLSDARA